MRLAPLLLAALLTGCARQPVVAPGDFTAPARPPLPVQFLPEDANCEEALRAALQSIIILKGHVKALEIILQGPPKKPDTSSEKRGKP